MQVELTMRDGKPIKGLWPGPDAASVALRAARAYGYGASDIVKALVNDVEVTAEELQQAANKSEVR